MAHSNHQTPPPGGSRPDTDSPAPSYKTYRSAPRLFRRSRDTGRLGELRPSQPGSGGRPEYKVHRSGPGLPDGMRPKQRRLGLGRIAGFVVFGALGWGLVSLALFMVSAFIQSRQMPDDTRAALSPAGFTFTSPNTILVLGSDARTEETAEPGSQVGGRARSDSIMLLRVGAGRSATLSIPRDTVVDIPGAGREKINAAYSLGGSALAVATVEQYLGIGVNHVVEVDFENFPVLVDALGGIEVRTGCVVSRINGGFRNGGYTLRLPRGVNELDGAQALALARTRTNECNPDEDDRTRARRQQLILAGMKDKVVSFETLLRLPWVAWQGPKAIRSDMAGPDLLGTVAATVTGGGEATAVLRPAEVVTLPDGGAGLLVAPEERQRQVERFLRG